MVYYFVRRKYRIKFIVNPLVILMHSYSQCYPHGNTMIISYCHDRQCMKYRHSHQMQMSCTVSEIAVYVLRMNQ